MSGRAPRMSGSTLKVLRACLLAPDGRIVGIDVSRAAGVAPGTLYPLLSRLETAGWLCGAWEEIDPRTAGRLRRKFYSLTDAGRRGALAAFEELRLPA